MDTTPLWIRNRNALFLDHPEYRGFRDITVNAQSVTFRHYLPVLPDRDAPLTLAAAPAFVLDADIGADNGFSLVQEETVTLDALRASAEYQDGSVYVFFSTHKGLYKGFFNLIAATAASRIVSYHYRMGCTNLVPIAFAHVQSVNDDFLGMKWVFVQDVHCPSRTSLDTSARETESIFEPDGMLTMYGFTTFVMSLAADEGDAFVVNVKAVEADGSLCASERSLYLQSNSGYLPRRKLTFTGETQFKLYKTGLDKGDVVEVKAGYRFWQNFSKLSLQV